MTDAADAPPGARRVGVECTASFGFFVCFGLVPKKAIIEHPSMLEKSY
jgi:hypothetical protein